MTRNYALEIDESFYQLAGKVISDEENLSAVSGCKFLVSDMERSISRVMTVESELKYAEALVVRSLQEEGEFDEPVSVITHWKKKRGKNSTQIFFTALPSRIYFKYLDIIQEHNDLLILIPIFSVLSNFVKQIAGKQTIAVVFRHQRFADVVVGDATQFFFATRCVAFDTSEEQISSLWQTVDRELSQVSIEQGIGIDQIVTLSWVDAIENLPGGLMADVECRKFQEETYTYTGKPYSISFGNALNMFPPMEGISIPYGLFYYYSERLSGFLVLFIVAAVLAMGWAGITYKNKADQIGIRAEAIENRLARLKQSIVIPEQQPEYENTLIFVDQMLHNRYLPSCKNIISTISKGVAAGTKVEELSLVYADRTIDIRLSGVIEKDFDKAYEGYQSLVAKLIQDGFVVKTNRFNTRIDSSRFELSLLWSIQ